MVVDDSNITLDEVKGFLTENGFDVITAVNGQEGLDQLKVHTEVKLIISDITMPIMDGITMIEKIRSELNNQLVKILVFTNENDPAMKKRLKAAKVLTWIVKPFDGPSILPVIKHLCAN